jgi:hypothetical protein
MRKLTTHKTNQANNELTITVMDEPGSGGASHHYVITGFNSATNPSDPFVERPDDPARYCTLIFQNGPIGEVGVNGITQEALLAIVIDRLQCFARGPYACRENSLALTKCEEALHWLQHRTASRVARGVEGTHEI